MIGLSYVRSGQKQKAQQEFEDFLNNYSNSEYFSVAKRYYRDI
jgi:TolA-binding protein